MPEWFAPLDPECPTVSAFMAELFNDPMTAAMGAPVDDICKDFERKHRKGCERCKEYGAANIEVSSDISRRGYARAGRSKRQCSIVIDCPPGRPRPDQLFPLILKDTGLEPEDFDLVSRLFGEFRWELREDPSKEQVYSEKRQVFKKRLTVLYRRGTIRYTSW
jgi:hypothetical protein